MQFKSNNNFNDYRKIALLLTLLLFIQGCVNLASDPRTSGTIIEDQAIELKIFNLIGADKALKNKIRINVTSYDNNVLLTGEALTKKTRARVVEHVRRVIKVQEIYNEITVMPLSSLKIRNNDAWITTKVKTKLFNDKGLGTFHTKAVTDKGVVYLMGLITHKEADVVTDTVRRIPGVRRVVRVFEYQD